MTEDDIWFDKFCAEFEEDERLEDAARDFQDSLLAHRYLQDMRMDGWRVEWGRVETGEWEARIDCSSIPSVVAARGRTRLSALSAVHMEAFRRLGIL